MAFLLYCPIYTLNSHSVSFKKVLLIDLSKYSREENLEEKQKTFNFEFSIYIILQESDNFTENWE